MIFMDNIHINIIDPTCRDIAIFFAICYILYVTFEAMEDEETTILTEKSTILDGRRPCRRDAELKPPQPPSWGWDWGWGWRLSSAIIE